MHRTNVKNKILLLLLLLLLIINEIHELNCNTYDTTCQDVIKYTYLDVISFSRYASRLPYNDYRKSLRVVDY
jgi:hypothetical protein